MKKQFYVVRTPFKAGGKYYAPGLLLSEEDLRSIKLHKIRLNERKIVRVPKDESSDQFKNLADYLKIRMGGVDLRKNLRERASQGSASAEQKKASASTPTPGTQAKGSATSKPTQKAPTKPVQKPIQKPNNDKK